MRTTQPLSSSAHARNSVTGDAFVVVVVVVVVFVTIYSRNKSRTKRTTKSEMVRRTPVCNDESKKK